MVAHTFNPSTWESTPLISTLKRWKQGGIWLGRETNIRWEETEAPGIQFENSWTENLVHFCLRVL